MNESGEGPDSWLDFEILPEPSQTFHQLGPNIAVLELQKNPG